LFNGVQLEFHPVRILFDAILWDSRHHLGFKPLAAKLGDELKVGAFWVHPNLILILFCDRDGRKDNPVEREIALDWDIAKCHVVSQS
jgi:hypothetical protein